jgi:hypothetical protein
VYCSVFVNAKTCIIFYLNHFIYYYVPLQLFSILKLFGTEFDVGD